MSARAPSFSPGCPACLAPPLDGGRLSQIRSAIDGTAEPVKGAMERLYALAVKFLETPRSSRRPVTVPVLLAVKDGKQVTSVACTPLEDAEVARIWDLVPWKDKATRDRLGAFSDDYCDQYGEVFETIPVGPVRDAAFHLLWFARELALDREPMTNDRI